MRWAQVDLDRGMIDFRTPDAPVTNKLPIPRKLLPPLRRARLRGTEMGFVINDNGARLGDRRSDQPRRIQWRYRGD